MQKEFWLERWQQNQTGFHRTTYNSNLLKFFPLLNQKAPAHIFVPLCGKSLDMLWLRDAGYHVTGVEVSQLAVNAFFAENNIEHQISKNNQFTKYASKNLEVWLGDFFALEQNHLPKIDAVYDRAAAVAMPADMRGHYFTRLKALLNNHTQILLVAMEYEHDEPFGPPFSVTAENICEHFGASYQIDELNSRIIEDIPANFAKKQITITEKAYRISRG